MLRQLKFIVCVFLVGLLSACSVYTLVEPTKPVKLRGMTLTVDINWTQFPEYAMSSDVASLWSIDGVLLNQLHIFGEVSEGDSLYKISSEEVNMPVFKADMLPNEIAELVSASLKNIYGGAISVDTDQLRPQKFGQQSGFSFNVNFFNGDGLNITGKAFASKYEDKLYMILYLAPDIHYYDRNIDSVESIVSKLVID